MDVFTRSCCPDASDEHFSESIRTSTGYVWSRGMESNVKDALVKLFPVGCDLLNTGLALKVPQPDAAIVTSGYEVEAMLVHCQAGHTVQVRHHAVHKCPCVVVIESDVSIFVTGYR